MIRQGHKVTIRNRSTGNTVEETELAGLAQGYVTGFLASATFQHFVSLFERFLMDLVALWLAEYPRSLSSRQVPFRTVLDSTDKDAIVAVVVQEEVYDLGFKRVKDWFDYLEKIAGLDCPKQSEIERLAEMKASRDVLVHNNGVVHSVYVTKSMGRARFAAGDKLELPERYHRESWELVTQVVTDLAGAAVEKLNT